MINRILHSIPGVLMAVVILVIGPLRAYGLSVANSKHNLSSSGPGTIKAVSESRICIFCHTPHRASPSGYLWNKDEGPVTYEALYESSTLKAAPGQPSGASKLCLSCHDGSVALGLLRSEAAPVAISGGVTTMPEGSGLLGLDLSDDHPISFSYDSSLAALNDELVHPSGLTPPIHLEGGNLLQCTSCHDAHDNQNGKFLLLDNAYSALCTACHKKQGWPTSSHSTSSKAWNGVSPDPWPHTEYTRVDINACENCHRPHSAGWGPRLLNAQAEEDNCFPCHNGNVASKNIQSELITKTYTHRVETHTGVHDPTEDPSTAQEHVECVDCHNPHAARAGAASAPLVSGPLEGVTGADSSGNLMPEAQYEYQICYKCHGLWDSSSTSSIPRQFPQSNIRLRFSPSNSSFHPIETQGRNSDVPSLRSPYTTSSIMYCTDCHNNDNGPGAGGMGPKGPHGSNNPFLLERRQDTQDRANESSEAYALCYKCHDRNSILNNQSFKEHEKHIREENSPCTACHDPHGVSSQERLINFDISIVSPNSNNQLRFEVTGFRSGRCYLRCHGENHNPESYSP